MKEKLSLIVRLKKHVDFLKMELKDFSLYSNISYSEYLKNRRLRRELERWIENILISIVDISKIILTLEDIEIPDTYRKIVENTQVILGKISIETGKYIHLRNVIVHEYLDIKWSRIENLLKNIKTFELFINKVENYFNNIKNKEENK